MTDLTAKITLDDMAQEGFFHIRPILIIDGEPECTPEEKLTEFLIRAVKNETISGLNKIAAASRDKLLETSIKSGS